MTKLLGRLPLLKSPRTVGSMWVSEEILEVRAGEMLRCTVRLVGWRLTPLLRGRPVPLTVCRSPAGIHGCDFEGVMTLECHLIPLAFSPRGSPGYPHMQERANGGMAVVLLRGFSVTWRCTAEVRASTPTGNLFIFLVLYVQDMSHF